MDRKFISILFVLTLLVSSVGVSAQSVEKKGIKETAQENQTLKKKEQELLQALEEAKQQAATLDKKKAEEKKRRQKLIEELAQKQQEKADLEHAGEVVAAAGKTKEKLKEIIDDAEKKFKYLEELREKEAVVRGGKEDAAEKKAREDAFKKQLAALQPPNIKATTPEEAEQQAKVIAKKAKDANALYAKLLVDIDYQETGLKELIVDAKEGKAPSIIQPASGQRIVPAKGTPPIKIDIKRSTIIQRRLQIEKIDSNDVAEVYIDEKNGKYIIIDKQGVRKAIPVVP